MSSKWMMVTAAVLASTVTAPAAILTSDTFTGTALSAQWTAYPTGGNTSDVTVAGGSVSTAIVPGDGNYTITSVGSTTGYVLPAGNFAVQIDESKGWSSGWWQYCYIHLEIGANAYELGKQWQSGSSGTVYTGVGNIYGGTVNLNYNDMQFKITRVGTTLTYYAKGLTEQSDWVTIDTATVAATDATFSFGVGNTGNNFVVSNWDNFVVVPEPASLALLGLGALGLLRRRR